LARSRAALSGMTLSMIEARGPMMDSRMGIAGRSAGWRFAR
jgi:hypothetical protein